MADLMRSALLLSKKVVIKHFPRGLKQLRAGLQVRDSQNPFVIGFILTWLAVVACACE